MSGSRSSRYDAEQRSRASAWLRVELRDEQRGSGSEVDLDTPVEKAKYVNG